MKQPVYAFLALVLISIISFFANPSSLLSEHEELPFVGVINVPEQELNDRELDEAIAEAEVEVEPQTEEETVDELEEGEGIALAFISEETKKQKLSKQEREELKEWRASLEQDQKKLFRKLVKKRKNKRPNAAPLNKDRAIKLLERAEARIAAKAAQQNPQLSPEETTNSLES